MKRFENLKILGVVIIMMMLFVSCDDNKKTVKMPISFKQENCDADFDIFFKKFASDSVFQKLHVKFPLRNSHLNDDYNDMIRKDIPLSKYTFIDFGRHKDAMKHEYDKFNVEVKKSKDSVFYFMKGYDNGIMTEMKFYYDGSCWKMVEIVDQST